MGSWLAGLACACRSLSRSQLQRPCAMPAHLAVLPRAACVHTAARQPPVACLGPHPATAAASASAQRRGTASSTVPCSSSSSSSTFSSRLSGGSSSRPGSVRRLCDWRAAAAGGTAAESAPQLAGPPQTKPSDAYGMQLPAGGKRCVAARCKRVDAAVVANSPLVCRCTVHPASQPVVGLRSSPACPPSPLLCPCCSMILTDAMALLYRSHYAFSEAHRLRNSAGTSMPGEAAATAAVSQLGRAAA